MSEQLNAFKMSAVSIACDSYLDLQSILPKIIEATTSTELLEVVGCTKSKLYNVARRHFGLPKVNKAGAWLTPDQEAAVDRLLRGSPMSTREIGEAVGCSHRSVKLRKQALGARELRQAEMY